ncbi:DMT family transporter [Mangrovicoccus sp. HB161399]|uniref:DMT family transporter n=1 Tax=Mangrovicoccus sp. HB161399 TaxID=2720392 RepID=UPI0015561F5C|nr:DMT family transporter [Mangrovicoccus sp. HB161399]
MTQAQARAGLLIMVAVTIGGAADSVIVRLLAGDIPAMQIGFTRALFGVLALAPLLAARPGLLRTQARWSHVLRAGLKLMSLVLLFAALQRAPLATVTAIGFASPLFVALGAWALLSEAPDSLRGAGLVLGFAGIVVILGPALGEAQGLALMLALGSAVLTASIQLMLKVMGRADGALTLVAWNLIVSVPLALLPAAAVWVWPTPEQWALLAAQGAIGTACQLGVTRALQLADASLVAPVDFLRLPFVALAAWVVFAEMPPLATFIGGAMVFAAVMVLSLAARPRRGLPSRG